MLPERLEIRPRFLVRDFTVLDIPQEVIHALDCAAYIGRTFKPYAIVFLQTRFRIFHHDLNVKRAIPFPQAANSPA